MLRAAAGSLVQYAELLDAISGLTWPSASRARAGDPGAHRSSRLGRSPEFTEYRAYRPGDDLRRLDWKLYGRTDRAYLRIADDHAALRTTIIVDASASMRFPLEGYGKWEHACSIALGLSSIAISDGDAVGVIATTQAGDRAIPPRRRRDLLQDAAELFHAVRAEGDASVADSIARAASAPRLAVVTDFLGEAERAIPALRVASASGSEIIAVHVVAEDEMSPPERTMLASDPERPAIQRALSDANRAAYQSAFASWRDRIAGELRAMHAVYVATTTTEPARDAVRRIVAASAAPAW